MNEFSDTNSPAARLLRDKGQAKLESTLGTKIETFFQTMSSGRSVVERLIHCREVVFAGIPSVLGDRPTHVRNTEVKAGNIGLPTADTVQTGFPQLVKTLDMAYQSALETDKGKRDSAAMRLASVVYSMGLILHPYRDGNGQTFRLTALSYIHELSPARRNQFFLPKQDSGVGRIYGFRSNDVNTLPAFLDPIVNQITDMRLKLPTADDETDYEGRLNPDLRSQAVSILGEAAQQLSDSQLVRALDEHARQRDPRAAVPLTQDEESRKKLGMLLNYLFSPAGQADISQYIKTGSLTPGSNEVEVLRKTASTCFERTEKQMEQLLIDRTPRSFWSRLFNR